jgi:alpha-1,2-mannosyltransferase
MSVAATPGRAQPLRTRVALVVVVGLVSGVLAARLARGHGDFDLRVYYGAVTSWLDGGSLYDFGLGSRQLGFTYPPFAAICMAPMTLAPLSVIVALNQVVIIAAVVHTTSEVVRSLPQLRKHGRGFVVALLAPMIFVLQPVRDTLTFGQVNIVLVSLVLLDLRALERRSRWAGVGIGLATAIKLTPGLFIVFLLVAGLRRGALTAAGTAGAATILAAAISPSTSWTYWSSTIFDSSRVGSIDSASNQSLAGLLARLANSGDIPVFWLPLVALLVGWGLWSARSLWRHDERLAAFTVVGLTAGVASPITWVHHLWWVVPGLLLLVDLGIRRRSGAVIGAGAVLAVLFASGLPDLTRARAGQHLTSQALAGENAYALACVVLLLVLPVLILRDRHHCAAAERHAQDTPRVRSRAVGRG